MWAAGAGHRRTSSQGSSCVAVSSEIPLFHVLNARITFSNLCGCDEPLSSVWVPAPSSGPAVTASGTSAGGRSLSTSLAGL